MNILINLLKPAPKETKMPLPPITLATVLGLAKSKEAQAIITLVYGMFGGGGGMKNMVGEQAGAIAQLIASQMSTSDYQILREGKLEQMKADLGPEIVDKIKPYLEVDDKSELFNSILMGWLLMVQKEFDNPNK